MGDPKILVTVCARQGSKGVPGKNIRPLLGKPLIAHSIETAKSWGKAEKIVVSTDSEEMARIARSFGAETPFLRPADLASDTAGKLPVLSHALKASEEVFKTQFDVLVDLDVTAPVRSVNDLNQGWRTFMEGNHQAVFSVVKARKSPYFNMIEIGIDGHPQLSKPLEKPSLRRQDVPQVWEANASIYFYRREFLLTNPQTLWEAKPGCFEMPPESAFDIDEERDFLLVEALMKARS